MSMRTLCIWIMISGFLGGAVLIVRSYQQKQASQVVVSDSRTIGFDPSMTIGLIQIVDGREQSVQRDPQVPGKWELRREFGDSELSSRAWNVEPNKIRAGLRALATGLVRTGDDSFGYENADSLFIRQRSGEQFRVEFGNEVSGGYVSVRIEAQDADGVQLERWDGRVERSLYDVFVMSGFEHWRSLRVFEVAASGVQSIALEAGGSSVTLARKSRGWEIEDPISIHGSRETIEDLVKVLISLEVDAFVDEEVNDETTGLANPIAQIQIGETEKQSLLTIGRRANVDLSTVYAQLETEKGKQLFTLKTDQLAKLTASVEAYISPVPSDFGVTDILGVKVLGNDGRPRFEALRSEGSWMIGESLADSINRDAIERLLLLLVRNQAGAVRVLTNDLLPTRVGSVVLVDRAEQETEKFEIALESDQNGLNVMLIKPIDELTSIVWVSNSDEAAASAAWLTAAASRRALSN
jgi:Domain of unknown function (DUF4340)